MKKLFILCLSLFVGYQVSAAGSGDIVVTSDSYRIDSGEQIVLTIKSSSSIDAKVGDYILFDYNYFTFVSYDGLDGTEFDNKKITFNKDMTIDSETVIGTLTLVSENVETSKETSISYTYYQDGKALFTESFDVNIDTEEYTPVDEEKTEIVDEKTNILPYIIGGGITITAAVILLIVIKKIVK